MVYGGRFLGGVQGNQRVDTSALANNLGMQAEIAREQINNQITPLIQQYGYSWVEQNYPEAAQMFSSLNNLDPAALRMADIGQMTRADSANRLMGMTQPQAQAPGQPMAQDAPPPDMVGVQMGPGQGRAFGEPVRQTTPMPAPQAEGPVSTQATGFTRVAPEFGAVSSRPRPNIDAEIPTEAQLQGVEGQRGPTIPPEQLAWLPQNNPKAIDIISRFVQANDIPENMANLRGGREFGQRLLEFANSEGATPEDVQAISRWWSSIQSGQARDVNRAGEQLTQRFQELKQTLGPVRTQTAAEQDLRERSRENLIANTQIPMGTQAQPQRGAQVWELMNTENPRQNAPQILETLRGSTAFQQAKEAAANAQGTQGFQRVNNALQEMSGLNEAFMASATPEQVRAEVDRLKQIDGPVGELAREFDTLLPFVRQQLINEVSGGQGLVNHFLDPNHTSGSSSIRPQTTGVVDTETPQGNDPVPGLTTPRTPSGQSEQVQAVAQGPQQEVTPEMAPTQPAEPAPRSTLRGLNTNNVDFTAELSQRIARGEVVPPQEVQQALMIDPVRVPETVRGAAQTIRDGLENINQVAGNSARERAERSRTLRQMDNARDQVVAQTRQTTAPAFRNVVRQQGVTPIRRELEQTTGQSLSQIFEQAKSDPVLMGLFELSAPQMVSVTNELRRQAQQLAATDLQLDIARQTARGEVKRIQAENTEAAQIAGQGLNMALLIAQTEAIAAQTAGMLQQQALIDAQMEAGGENPVAVYLETLKAMASVNPQHLEEGAQTQFSNLMMRIIGNLTTSVGLQGVPDFEVGQTPGGFPGLWSGTGFLSQPTVVPVDRVQPSSPQSDQSAREFLNLLSGSNEPFIQF